MLEGKVSKCTRSVGICLFSSVRYSQRNTHQMDTESLNAQDSSSQREEAYPAHRGDSRTSIMVQQGGKKFKHIFFCSLHFTFRICWNCLKQSKPLHVEFEIFWLWWPPLAVSKRHCDWHVKCTNHQSDPGDTEMTTHCTNCGHDCLIFYYKYKTRHCGLMNNLENHQQLYYALWLHVAPQVLSSQWNCHLSSDHLSDQMTLECKLTSSWHLQAS